MNSNPENVTQQGLTAMVNKLRLKRFAVRDVSNEEFAFALLKPCIYRPSMFVRINAIFPRLVDGALSANDRKAARLFTR